MAKMEKGLVLRAAGILMAVQVASRVLGYARDVILMNMFGQGYVTDAYNAAFSIPDFLYNVLIGGAISCAFIPVFSSYIAKGEEKEAWKVCSIFTSWILLLLAVGVVVAAIFTNGLLGALTDYTGAELVLPVFLTRLTLIQVVFMALSAISTGVLQSYQHFTWPAMGALFYNICIILGGIFLCGPIEARWPGYGVTGFSIGVVVGAVFTLVVQIPNLKQVGFRWRFQLDTTHPGLHELVRLIIPVLIGLSVSQINLFVTQKLATGLEYGVYSAMKTANRFMQLPLGVFATAIATAIFPTMTAQAAVKDFKEMKNSLSVSVRSIIFVCLPSAVGLALLARPIIRLLYEFSGKFTAADTEVCAQALIFYCIGLAGYGAVQGTLRGFYAIKDTLTPVLVSAGVIVFNIVLSLLLVDTWGHIGLALAYSLAGLLQWVVLLVVLRTKLGQMDIRRLVGCILRTGVCCAAMAAGVLLSCYGVELFFGISSKLSQLLQVVVSVGVGVILFFVTAWLLKMEELKQVTDHFGGRFRRRRSA